MYATKRSGWIAIGKLVGADQWATSEWVYTDKKEAVKNLMWCYNVLENTVKTVKVELK